MWDQRYSEPGFAYGTEPNDFLREVLPRLQQLAGRRVLSLGEGEGRNGVFLAQAGFEVTSVDQSAVGLQKAAALARERGVSVTPVVADLASYQIAPASWNVVVSLWCHLPPALRRSVHAAAARGLAPGGALVLEAYTPNQLELGTGGPRSVELLMRLEELKTELAPLEFEIGRELERQVQEGAFHSGRSAVVQVLAFKRAG